MGKNCFCGHGHRVEVRNSALSGAAHKGRAAGCVCVKPSCLTSVLAMLQVRDCSHQPQRGHETGGTS